MKKTNEDPRFAGLTAIEKSVAKKFFQAVEMYSTWKDRRFGFEHIQKIESAIMTLVADGFYSTKLLDAIKGWLNDYNECVQYWQTYWDRMGNAGNND